MVPEAHDAASHGFRPCGTLGIVCHLLGVLPSNRFNKRFGFYTSKIKDIWPNHHLTPALAPLQATPPVNVSITRVQPRWLGGEVREPAMSGFFPLSLGRSRHPCLPRHLYLLYIALSRRERGPFVEGPSMMHAPPNFYRPLQGLAKGRLESIAAYATKTNIISITYENTRPVLTHIFFNEP